MLNGFIMGVVTPTRRSVIAQAMLAKGLSKCACVFVPPERMTSANGPDPCELALNPRYRKGPDVCFDNHVDVSQVHCSSTYVMVYVHALLTRILCLVFLSLSVCLSMSVAMFSTK